MSAVLELVDVCKAFPGHVAVDCVTLQVERGSLFSLVGPSGCGKTTTLRLIAGFEQATRGDILLGGTQINHLRPYQRNVTTVFQNYALFPHLSVRGNVEFGLRRRGCPDMRSKLREVLELVQLSGKESRMPSELSGGEKQRVALARALVLEPDVLLLDEPLSALDPQLRKQVRSELRALQKRVGITFLLVTHDQEEALSMSDRVAVMRSGRIEQVGCPRELYEQPASRFVAGFLGPMNWVNGAGVRPELTRIAREYPGGEAIRVFPARVQSNTFLGNCVHVETLLSTGDRVTAEVPASDAVFQAGEQVHVWWRSRDELPLGEEKR